MSWQFRYAGPARLFDDRDCSICTTVAKKKCKEYGAPALGCPHCKAVETGMCPSHCGLANALKLHEAILFDTDPRNSRWKRVEAVARASVEADANLTPEQREVAAQVKATMAGATGIVRERIPYEPGKLPEKQVVANKAAVAQFAASAAAANAHLMTLDPDVFSVEFEARGGEADEEQMLPAYFEFRFVTVF